MPDPDAPTAPLTAPAPLFVTGQIVMTQGAIASLTQADVEPMTLIERHVRLDPGNLDREDRTANRWNASHGLRVLSEYLMPDQTKVWLITESDRSATTILLPEEY